LIGFGASALGFEVRSVISTSYIESCSELYGFAYSMKSFDEGKLPAYKASLMQQVNEKHLIVLDQIAAHARVHVNGPTVLHFKTTFTYLPVADENEMPMIISNASFSTFDEGVHVQNNEIHVDVEGSTILNVDLTVMGLCRFYSGDPKQLLPAVDSAIRDTLE
jgi:hypothetical protein